MLIADNRGHDFLRDICDMVWHLPDGEGDVWIYDDGKKVPSLKYEIKNLPDFINRLTSDSLNMQLEKVDGIVLIGGDDFVGFTGHWTFSRLQTVLNGVLDHTRVYRVADLLQLDKFLRLREEKVKDGTFGLITKRKPKVKSYPSMVEALTNVPKISYVIAERIYHAFDSLGDLVDECRRIRSGDISVDDSRFIDIEKVGKVLARRVVDWVIQDWPSPISLRDDGEIL